MDINFDLSTLFDTDIVRLDIKELKKLPPRKFPVIKQLIDKMGELSTQAQGLKKTLTSYDKLVDGAESEEQRMYILWENSSVSGHSLVIGILKISSRQLYLYDRKEQMHRCKPVNILDFYVHTSRQRKGYGHLLYDQMLQMEGQYPGAVAIDKPSESLLCFMKKHYQLTDPIWQNTHYVIYPVFFEYLKNPPGPPPPSSLQHGSNVVDVVDGLPASIPMSDKWVANSQANSQQNTNVAPVQPPTPTPPPPPQEPVKPQGANAYAKQRMIASMQHQSIF